MADRREQILSRLLTVCQGITGIVAAVRNRLDANVVGTVRPRPAIVIQDGAETLTNRIQPATRHRFGQLQMMELHPVVELRLRADSGSEAGELVSLFRGRVLNAICGDATLQSYVGSNGDIWLESFSQPEPAPETQEPRASFEFAFLYPLKRSDLLPAE